MTLRILVIVALGMLGSCAREAPPVRAPEMGDEAGATPGRVEISPVVRRNLGITFAGVERRRVERTIRIPGASELRPLARREYRLTLPGTVRLAVDQYERIGAGDLLFRFRSPRWPELQHEIVEGEQSIGAAEASIGVARARIEETTARLAVLRARLASLDEASIRSAPLEADARELEAMLPRLRAELRQAETTLENARRTRAHALHRAASATGLAEARLAAMVEENGEMVPAYRAIDWIEVRATEAGVVEALSVTDGGFAEATTLVLSTVDPGMVRFRAMALQSDLSRIGEARAGRIVPPREPGIPAGAGVAASVSIGLEAHPDQRTVTLLAAPEASRAWIRPGVSAFLEVAVESTGGPALAIPRAAVVRDGITHVFFRRDPADPNAAIRVEADLGADDGRWVAIKSGLGPGDEVVLDGAYELKLATQQSGAVQKGGHFHADGTFHEDDH